MWGGGEGRQESVNQKFNLYVYSYTARIKVTLTHTKEFVVQRTHSLHYSLQCNSYALFSLVDIFF